MSYGKNAAKAWYNNGRIEGMYDNPPKGWVKGRLTEENKVDKPKREIPQRSFSRPQRKS